MTTGSYWAVAQTVTTMEHVVRREIEKTNRGAFLPTKVRFWKVDGREYAKEVAALGGYVFFVTNGEDWAGVPDIHGVYGVLVNPDRTPMRVSASEMARMEISHAAGHLNETLPPRFTKYYRPPTKKSVRFKRSRKPRPGNRLRNATAA